MGQVLDPLLVALVNGRQYAALQSPRRNAANTAYEWGTPLWSDKVPGDNGNMLWNNDGTLAASYLISHASRGNILTVKSGAVTDKPLVVKGILSQTGNLQEWQNSSRVLASVNAQGVFSGGVSGNTGSLLWNNDGVLDASNLVTHSPRGTILSVRAGCATDTLQQWKDSLGNVVASLTTNGTFGLITISGSTSTTSLQIFGSIDCRAGITCSQPLTAVGKIRLGQSDTTAIDVPSDGGYTWRSSTFQSGSVDTGLRRAAAKVINVTGATTSVGGTLSSPPLSPTTLTADQNDYNPGVARRYRLSTDGLGARNVTGLSISQVDGQEFSVVNVGTDSITLKHQSASSTAANRFICTGATDIVLATDEEALVWYDSTTTRFRVRKV